MSGESQPVSSPGDSSGAPDAVELARAAELTRAALLALKETGATLAVAESCTGGWLGQVLTSVPGSSAAFVGGVIAYADRIKRDLLQVEQGALARHGAVSEPVARQMASGARRRLDTDWAVAITGIAGPGGGTDEKPVGTVWLAVDGARPATEHHLCAGSRDEIRATSVARALELLLRRLDS